MVMENQYWTLNPLVAGSSPARVTCFKRDPFLFPPYAGVPLTRYLQQTVPSAYSTCRLASPFTNTNLPPGHKNGKLIATTQADG